MRDAAGRWRSAGAPYELARGRPQAARAAAALGDRADAVRRARSALAAFEQLGASLDVQATAAHLVPCRAAGQAMAGMGRVLRAVFGRAHHRFANDRPQRAATSSAQRWAGEYLST